MGANTSGLTGTANQLSAEQSQVLNQMLQMIGGIGGDTGALTALLPQLGGIFSNLTGVAGQQLPGLLSQYMSLANNPAALAQLTGVNAPGLMQQATGYLSQPGQTNLAQLTPGVLGQMQAPSYLGQAGPQAEAFYRNEMTQGINPQFALNAQNQLQQQFGTAVSDLYAQARPGENIGSQALNLTDQLLASSSNLGGQLAGQSQQIAGQGAAGLTGTAQAMDTGKLQNLMAQLQSAGMLDSQTMQMLLGGAQLGNQYNQQWLGNIGQGVGAGQSILGQSAGLGQMGLGAQEFSAGQLGNLGQYLGNQAFDYTQLASQIAAQNNPWSALFGGLGSAAGLYSSFSQPWRGFGAKGGPNNPWSGSGTTSGGGGSLIA